MGEIKKNRNVSLDILRILSCLMVICIHVSTREGWYSLPTNSSSWLIMHFFNFICRVSIPIFFMISGNLFLSKDNISIKNLYLKNILRLLLAYFIFSTFYYFITNNNFEINLYIQYLLSPKFHLWYLPAIISVYVFLPLLKKISSDDKILSYSLILFFIFSIIIPTLKEVEIFRDFFLIKWLGVFDVYIISYSGYFLLGYYLGKINIEKYKKLYLIIIYLLTCLIFSSFSAYYMNQHMSFPKKSIFYSYFSISTFIESICLYLFFLKINLKKLSQKLFFYIEKISNYTFGIYLIHIFVLEEFLTISKIDLSYNTIIKIPIVTFFVFFVSLVVIMLLKKIPFLKKII